MSWTGKWNAAMEAAKSLWDPAKHPRGRDGKFLEVGDLVAVFSGPNSGQIDTGSVVAGHLATDGRFFVGVKSKVSGDVKWYRPKQVEQISPKAALPPKMPIPALADKPGSVDWDESQISVVTPHIAGKKASSVTDPTTGHSIGIGEFGELTDYGPPAKKPAVEPPESLPGSVESKIVQAGLADSIFEHELDSVWGDVTYVQYKAPSGPNVPGMFAIHYEFEGEPGVQLYDSVDGENISHKFAPNEWSGGPGWTTWLDPANAKADAKADATPTGVEIPGQLGVNTKSGAAGIAAVITGPDGMYYAHVPTADNPEQTMQFNKDGVFITTFDSVGWSDMQLAPQYHTIWSSPDAPSPQPEPTGDPAKLDLVHKGIITSAANKLNAGTLGPQGSAVFNKIDDMLQAAIKDPDEQSAQKYLATAMTLAKLGGKQRARYKKLLAEGRGSTAPQLAPSKIDTGVTGDHRAPAVAKLAPGQKAMNLTNGNGWVQGGGANPQSAKAGVQRDLTARLGDVPTEEFAKILSGSPGMHDNSEFAPLAQAWRAHRDYGTPIDIKARQLGGSWVAQSKWNAPGASWITPTDNEHLEQMIRETAVNALIQTWAATSNDSNVRSLAIQDAAAAEFGLDPEWIFNWHAIPAEMDSHTKAHGATYRRFVREMYNNTQAELKKTGFTHVRLRRGSKQLYDSSGKQVYGSGKSVNIKLRPLSSFTSNTGTASGFSGGGRVVDTYVPIERILGSARTGFGCWGEYEYVVLGGPNEMDVIK